jgi:YD repeat-containing protein
MSRHLADSPLQRISLACVLISFLCFARLAAAQVNPGTPPFSGYDGGQYDIINLQNLNVLLNVPVMSKPGAFPFNFAMTGGGSYVYVNPNNHTVFPGIFQNPFVAIVNGTLGGPGTFVNVTTETSVTCPSGFGSGAADAFSGWYIQLSDGTMHSLPATDTSYSGTTCSGGFTDQVTDGSGYTLSVSSGVTVSSIYTKDGTKLAIGSITDSNSNAIAWNLAGKTWADTLGLTTLTQASSGISWDWTDVNGGSPTVSWTVPGTTYRTAYGCTGIADSTNSGSYPLPTAVNFPDNTTLGLAWEQTPGYSSDTTGRLVQITLRSGSTVSYNWNPNSAANDGLNCTYLVPNKMTRTTSDGSVTYTLAFFQISGSNYGETDTKIDVGGNKTVSRFTGLTSTGNAAAPTIQALTETQYYVNTGTVSRPAYSSTPTKLVIYCYNSSSPTVSACPTATVQGPVKEVDTFTQLSGMSNYARQQIQYDGGPSGALALYGNVTYSAQYDFGGTAPITATTIVYGTSNGSGTCSAIGNNVNNKPCTVVSTQNGNTVVFSQFTYNSHGNLLRTYVSPNGGSSFLSNSTANSYNGNGTPIYRYDLANNPISYTYSSSGYTSCGSCTQYPFPTSVTKGGLTTSYTWNGIGGVMLTQVGPNGSTNQTATYGYENSSGTADPWWRVRSLTDPLGNETWITPTVTSYETSFAFNNSIQNITTTFDGYGRPINVQKQQGPSATNYDTVSTTYNFSGVNPTTFTSNPCSQTSGNACTGVYGPTNTYDMLGRLVSSVQSGSNGTDTITYSENDVLNVLKPAPSGENIKQAQNQYDGLGRLTSTCAVSSSASGNVSCNQNTATSPTNGILTTITYSSGTGYQTITTTRGSQSRSNSMDGLGRVTQKASPEGGTWTYTYDTNSSCPSGYRGVSGRLASIKDPNGNLLCYNYDALNRVTGVNADGTTCRHFYYDNSSGYSGTIPTGITLTNQYGRMVEAATDTCSSGTLITDEWFAYDKDGNKTNLWQLTPHSTQYYQSTATFFGNGVAATVDLASPSLYMMTYGLDGEGRISTLTDTTASQNIVTGTTYFPATTTPTVSLTGSDNDAYTIDLNTNRIDKFVFTVGSNNLTGTLNWNANGTLGYLAVTDGFNSGVPKPATRMQADRWGMDMTIWDGSSSSTAAAAIGASSLPTTSMTT